MTKSNLRQRDLERVFRAAKAAGSTVQIDPNTLQITVFPFAPSQAQVLAKVFPDDAREIGQYPNFGGWDEREEKAQVPNPIDPKAVLAKWHASIGFDPDTMKDADLQRLQKEREERWREEIPSRPMTKLEVSALKQLLSYGPGVAVDTKLIKRCGPDTIERLEARGFIEFRMRAKFPDRIDAYVLTQAGHQAATSLEQP